MGKKTSPLQAVFNHQGEPVGVFIPVEVWHRIAPTVEPLVNKIFKRAEEQKPEPMDDWQMLQNHWDFRYPVDVDVTCGACGNTTSDWRADDPRKFRLLAVSLGGLVSFGCQSCKAKIIKRHFKDRIAVETKPFKD